MASRNDPLRLSSPHIFLVRMVVFLVLAAFVALILSPALSAHGRIWEKAAAGFLSLFVLAALIVGGVVIGLAIVYYYTDIVNFINGE